MSTPQDALLRACLMSSKIKLIENTRQGALAAHLLDLAVLCSRLACEHMEASALTAAQQIQQVQTNARDAFALYTRVTGGFQNVLTPFKSRNLPSWDGPADPAKPSLPPVHLSSAAMGELVATLVPLLHIPVEKSLLSTIILSLQDPLAEALRSTMMDQMEEDLLERLTNPLFEQLLPRIRDKISERLVQEEEIGPARKPTRSSDHAQTVHCPPAPDCTSCPDIALSSPTAYSRPGPSDTSRAQCAISIPIPRFLAISCSYSLAVTALPRFPNIPIAARPDGSVSPSLSQPCAVTGILCFASPSQRPNALDYMAYMGARRGGDIFVCGR
ncbi:hypothetical protein VTO73DRAFT_5256 [Trametes versicolor]